MHDLDILVKNIFRAFCLLVGISEVTKMAAFFDDGGGNRVELTSDLVLQLLGDGNDSEVEGLGDDDDMLFRNSSNQNPAVEIRSSCTPIPPPVVHRTGNVACRRPGVRRRIWKQVSFNQKEHNYLPRARPAAIRSPMEYFNDYFDDEFFEHSAMCTNNYYMRRTGCILNTNAIELKKLVGIHLIMGVISYPRLYMYWRDGMRLDIVAKIMARERFKTLRSAFHVVDSDTAEPGSNSTLWKIQPILDRVKRACDRLERQPGFYSIDEQMLPFSGVCPRGLRQVIKSKPRPQGLKIFVATTHDGLMIDFEVYRGSDTPFGDRSLGVGAAVILHLSKSIPRGSCIYFDRYFSSIPLLEKLNSIGLHGTATLMMNRIPERKNIDFKPDRRMKRGESQQFVCDDIVVVKWMDNKSVLVASNCTSADDTVFLKRWDKSCTGYIDVSAPKTIANYNRHMGGVDILDQSMEYYRTFIKTRKWTLKVILHFIDLAVCNAWRLYKIECAATQIQSNKIMDLMEFRMQVADGLTNSPVRQRRSASSDDDQNEVENLVPNTPKYKRSNQPSTAKRYDGYDHLPAFEEIDNPRACRLERCRSRSKIKCEKGDVYLCLTRKQNCFAAYHKKN
ncbi:piggyBac transposable element-derived protein 3-like [Bicyclus anynana]|uniref:PiggyBac transposable element-derived protein 3-like n=1 Tax=Bicyclus anynana TaxID=110368 RepID=A0ABM3LFZ5_BICAN|nr:piggyBac transposable element-derived protein 3-like [Bicyclus anynana]XP_052737982.1 piggyBac transposable element-derived protein 3-like [Bicyclus anynana]XP_052737983.1 piggyBac transposable element-derived protein 3-like [Bicyclus anynana]